MKVKMKKAAPKKFQRGGTVEESDRPEERGSLPGRRYNRLLEELRDSRKRERAADELLPNANFEGRMRQLERQGFFPPSGEELARRAGRKAAERTERVGRAQRLQRIIEGDLEREGRRIGQSRFAGGRLEDSGFKKGGLIKKKAGGMIGKPKGKK